MLWNFVLYFLTVPVAYLFAVAWTEPERRSDGWMAIYNYVFTTPSWPAVLALLPILELCTRSKTFRSYRHWRSTTVVLAAVLIGVTTLVVFRDLRWCLAMAAGGAAYGAAFRVRRIG